MLQLPIVEKGHDVVSESIVKHITKSQLGKLLQLLILTKISLETFSDLGSRVIKTYQKPTPPKATPRPAENSVEVDNEDQKTARSIKLDHKRRRSRTGDQIKGLAFKITQKGNFVEEEELDHHKTDF